MTLTRTKIVLLMGVLMIPLASTNAFGDGSAEIVTICSFDPPGSIEYGSITRGMDSIETSITLEDAATEVTTIELQASDWYGDEGDQTASLQFFMGDLDPGDAIFIGGEEYIGVTYIGNDRTEFNVSGSANSDRNYFVSQYNMHGNRVAEASIVNDEILLTAITPGTSGNSILFNFDAQLLTGPKISIGGGNAITFQGGAPGITHLQSEVTRFNITTDGSDSSGTTYAEKTPIGQAGAFATLTTQAQPFTDVNISFQITGVDPALENMPYSGSVTQTMTFTFSCTE